METVFEVIVFLCFIAKLQCSHLRSVAYALEQKLSGQ